MIISAAPDASEYAAGDQYGDADEYGDAEPTSLSYGSDYGTGT